LNADQFNQFNHTNCANTPFGWELQVAAPASDQVWVVPQSRMCCCSIQDSS
jgi:hypothetical protein